MREIADTMLAKQNLLLFQHIMETFRIDARIQETQVGWHRIGLRTVMDGLTHCPADFGRNKTTRGFMRALLSDDRIGNAACYAVMWILEG